MELPAEPLAPTARVVASPDTADFLGLRFDRLTLDEALAMLAAHPAGARFGYVVTPNVDHVVRLERDRDGLAALYAQASLCLCDSRILSAIARLHGIELPVVPGSDLTAAIFRQLMQPGDRVCIIGGSADLPALLANRFPGLDVAQHVPPMGLLRNPQAMADAAAFAVRTSARFTFLALGSPQQELLAALIARDEATRGYGLCVGAGIEFLTGEKTRAPRWMQRAGLEWSFRLISEPRRMWRRYLVDGPRIFRIARRWARKRAAGAKA